MTEATAKQPKPAARSFDFQTGAAVTIKNHKGETVTAEYVGKYNTKRGEFYTFKVPGRDEPMNVRPAAILA